MRIKATLLFLILLLGSASAAVGGQAARRERMVRLSFLVPEGWHVKPTVVGNNGLAVIGPEIYPIGKSMKQADMFVVRTVLTGNHTLEDFKNYLLKLMTGDVKKNLEQLKKEFVPVKQQNLDVDIDRDLQVKVKKVKVGKTPAYEFEVASVLLVEGIPIRARSRQIVCVFQDRCYIVTAGYPIAREKKVKPVADAFLSTLRLETSP